MDLFSITGGNPLHGELPVNGAKNHALKLIPAALLAAGDSRIANVPDIEDVSRMLEIVENIGGSVKRTDDGTVTVTPPAAFGGTLPDDLVPTLRASLVLLGPLLARFGKVVLPLPGGDNIGKRPIDFFVEGFRQLGADVSEQEGLNTFTAGKGLVGATIVFPRITVTGTETLMMAATLANGTTVLRNAACEPEVEALAAQLNSAGAKIAGAGTHTITIQGVDQLRPLDCTVVPDRIETGSFIILAAATRSNLTITQCDPAHIEIPLSMLERAGVEMNIGTHAVEVLRTDRPYRPVDLVTHEYPGFPTDLQAPMTVFLTQAEGVSHIRETIYDGRLLYTDMLNSMGAEITLIDQYRADVHGPTRLQGTTVASPDIRAGIAMIIAGLLAEGVTTIEHIYQVDRGYERIEQRLKAVGAAIERIQK